MIDLSVFMQIVVVVEDIHAAFKTDADRDLTLDAKDLVTGSA